MATWHPVIGSRILGRPYPGAAEDPAATGGAGEETAATATLAPSTTTTSHPSLVVYSGRSLERTTALGAHCGRLPGALDVLRFAQAQAALNVFNSDLYFSETRNK